MCAVVLDLFNIVEYYKSRFICIILLLCSFRKLSGARVNSWFLDHIMTLKCNERCVSASNLLNLIWPPNSKKEIYWKFKKRKKRLRYGTLPCDICWYLTVDKYGTVPYHDLKKIYFCLKNWRILLGIFNIHTLKFEYHRRIWFLHTLL